MTLVQYANELVEQRAAVERQLARLKAGLKVASGGVDHTGSHFALLSKIAKSYDRLLATVDVRPAFRSPSAMDRLVMPETGEAALIAS